MQCIRKGCKNDAIMDRTYGVIPCASCQKKDEKYSINKPAEFASLNQLDRVRRQRDKHEKDMIPVWWKDAPNPEFARAFPAKAKEFYTKEELSKL
jgi:hypothetical protein